MVGFKVSRVQVGFQSFVVSSQTNPILKRKILCFADSPTVYCPYPLGTKQYAFGPQQHFFLTTTQ